MTDNLTFSGESKASILARATTQAKLKHRALTPQDEGALNIAIKN
jgi:hypothetical protein